MNASFRVDLGKPTLLEFRGPDAVRFLNGQMTQDVRRVVGSDCALPSCVTDAKGKLQFRIYLTESPDKSSLLVSAPEGCHEALEARLTKYLIADDVEVSDLSGKYHLYHLVHAAIPASGNAFARKAKRYGVEGVDLWIPADETMAFPPALDVISDDEMKTFRISYGIPAWGNELTEGMLPPEGDLDITDISYHKGCYIGQEVISRIKSAGKVNRSLLELMMDADVPAADGDELFVDEVSAGFLTSVAPIAKGDFREALGLVKRGANRGGLKVKAKNGVFYEVKMRC